MINRYRKQTKKSAMEFLRSVAGYPLVDKHMNQNSRKECAIFNLIQFNNTEANKTHKQNQ
jgi:hypothetical protein